MILTIAFCCLGSCHSEENYAAFVASVSDVVPASCSELPTQVSDSDVIHVINISLDDGIDLSTSSDSALIITPDTNIMVDVGRYDDYDIIKAVLSEHRIDRIDYIFLSHYHHDHCGCTYEFAVSAEPSVSAECSSLFRLFSDADIDTSGCVVILPYPPETSNLYSEDERTEETNVKNAIKKVTDHFDILTCVPSEDKYWNVSDAKHGTVPDWVDVSDGDIYVHVLNCCEEKWERLYSYPFSSDEKLGKYNARTYNNFSTIIELYYGRTTYTFAGDLNYSGERLNYEQMHKTDVLKMGHHLGNSMFTPEYYAQLSPEYAVFSVDCYVFNNFLYGDKDHRLVRPAISWLNENGAKLFFTARDGTLIWETDGKKYRLLNEKSK